MSFNVSLLCTWWLDFRQRARVLIVYKCHDGTVRPCTCSVTPVQHMTNKSYTLWVTWIENCCLLTWESVYCKVQKHQFATYRQSLTFVQPILSCIINLSLPFVRWIRTFVHFFSSFSSSSFFLGPVSLCSRCTTAVGVLYSPKHSIQHRFNNPVLLIKRQRSLTKAVLMSFGSTISFPKAL